MNKFAIFKSSDKFYWTTSKIIYSIIFLCLIIIFFKQNFLNLKKDSFDNFLFLTIALVFIYGLILNFIGFTKIKPLHGNLDGYLSFEKDCIKINDEIYFLEKIKSIQISNDDYSGKFVGSRGNFGPSLSNGTNNYLIIFPETGKTKKYQFEMINSNDFQNIRTILIEYHIKKKIDFWELANTLEQKSTEEIAGLTKEIETIKNTTTSIKSIII